MGQSCSSVLCLGEGDDAVLANSYQRNDTRLLNHAQQHQRGGCRKKGQKKRGSVQGNLASDCVDPKLFNLMSQSILQQQMLHQQQQQQQQLSQSLPSTATAAAASSTSSSASKPQQAAASSALLSMGGQTHLLYRKHPKSILALAGNSSSSTAAQQSQNLLTISPKTMAPWGPLPRRNVPTKLIVRRPRRGTFPLSYQDEGLSGTQIYAIRYYLNHQHFGGKAKEFNTLDPSALQGRASFDNNEENFEIVPKEEDQDCIWMMMQDDDDEEDGDEDDDVMEQRRRQRQQEQCPGGRKSMGSSLSQSAAASLPTLLPLCHANSGSSFGYSTSVPSNALRDLERNTRMRQPSTTTNSSTVDGAAASAVTATGNSDASNNSPTGTWTTNTSAADGSAKTGVATNVSAPSWAPSTIATQTPATVTPSSSSAAAAWSTSNPSAAAAAAAAAASNGDFFTPQALAMRQPRQVLDWITISEEYNIHVADVGLTPAECDHLVQVTEQVCRGQYAAYTYAKQTLGCREYPSLAQACLDPVHTVVEAIRTYTTLHPHNSSAYFGCNNLQLDDREPHMVKYDVTKKERQKLDMHTDKSEWTFLIALSNGCGLDYDGGGTFFECLDATIHVQRGHALIFPGKLRHCGQRITTGLRFILVGFLVDKPMLPLGSTPAAATSNLLAANARSGPMAIPPDHHRA